MKAQLNSVNSSVEYIRRGVDVHGDRHHVSSVGKVHKKSNKKDEKESQEIKAYLNKLQELVPFTPKNKKLSKLEVISYVIDYIQDLRETLGLPPSPCQNGSDQLDQQFTWMLMDSSSSAVVHGDDDDVYHQQDSSGPLIPPPPPPPPATVTATAIAVSSSNNVTSFAPPQPFPNRQPLCVISKPGGNVTPSLQTHYTMTSPSSSVKPSGVLSSSSSGVNCDYQIPK